MFKILLVDDDPDVLELLTFNFAEAGFKVHTATTGLDALNEARRVLPSAIVLDLLLPDLDGITICEILRRQPSTRSIPILMLTAVGGQISRWAGLEAGADEYLTKTIRPRDLVSRVQHLLGRENLDMPTPRVL